MDDIQVLLAQRAELDKKITEARRERRGDAIAKIRALMAEHGLSAADIAGKVVSARASAAGSVSPSSGTSTGKVAAKYRNAATGDAWTGRGLQPRWLRAALEGGAKIEDFKI